MKFNSNCANLPVVNEEFTYVRSARTTEVIYNGALWFLAFWSNHHIYLLGEGLRCFNPIIDCLHALSEKMTD